MTDIYTFVPGDLPLLISIPHDGRALMPGQVQRMTGAGRSIPDTDWHVRQLYRFAIEFGANIIGAQYSRYVIDLNRPADDTALYAGRVSTGLCPTKTFGGEDIYLEDRSIGGDETARRIKRYWRPYHEKIRAELDSIKDRFGYALLWDAHSIPGKVPLLFDGSLPDLSIGTNDGQSCSDAITGPVMEIASSSRYSAVLNGRFKGGYITRHYGCPADGVHAIQLELAQRNYMNETSREFDESASARLRETLRAMVTGFTESAAGSRKA